MIFFANIYAVSLFRRRSSTWKGLNPLRESIKQSPDGEFLKNVNACLQSEYAAY